MGNLRTRKLWTKEDDKQAIAYVEEGKIFKEIAELMGRTQSSINSRMTKLGIKSPRNPAENFKNAKGRSESFQVMYDWNEIQEFYDKGNTQADVIKKFGTSYRTIYKAIDAGLFFSRNKSDASKLRVKLHGAPKHTEATKKKLSKIRKEYLNNNPEKVPYLLNHSSKQSWPEEHFEKALKKNKIKGWEYNYSFYRFVLDFAFPAFKLDVEIDGGTHDQPDVKAKDKERDKLLKKHGWTVLRIPAKDVKADVQETVERLKKLL